MRWLLCLVFAVAREAGEAGSRVAFDSAAGVWEIGNESIRVAYRFDGAAGSLSLASLRAFDPAAEWAGNPASAVWDFTWRGSDSTVDSRSGWRLENWSEGPLAERGRELVIRLRHPASETGVEFHLECAARPGSRF